jgi:hypothetical protein
MRTALFLVLRREHTSACSFPHFEARDTNYFYCTKYISMDFSIKE